MNGTGRRVAGCCDTRTPTRSKGVSVFVCIVVQVCVCVCGAGLFERERFAQISREAIMFIHFKELLR